jgi:hypothetical protein
VVVRDSAAGLEFCFPTHVVRFAAAIHPIDEDLSMGTQ